MFAHTFAIFDMDGTLCPSKSPVSPEMGELLNKLSKVTKIAVISGASFAQFEKQLLPVITPSPNIILLPTDGNQHLEYDDTLKKWQVVDKKEFPRELKSKVLQALATIIASKDFDIPQNPAGNYIEDRDTEVNFSALGQHASIENKQIWDPDQKKRKKIKVKLESMVEGLTVSVAGTTSLDIFPQGRDKAFGLDLFLKKMNLSKKDVVFVGDAIFPGGNDYPAREMGLETMPVSGPAETAEIIQRWLSGGEASFNFPENPIAFFCTEYALEDDSLMYAGGLGILASDYLLEMADRNMPCIALGLNYDPGHLKDFVLFSHKGKPLVISFPFGQHTIHAQVWHRVLAEKTHIFLLDTNIDANDAEHRIITSLLYDPHFYNRVKQQAVLGIGGMKILQALDIHPSIYHLNEGHTAFGGIAVMVERKKDLSKVVGTKHTILSQAGLHIPQKDFVVMLEAYCKEFGVNVSEVFEKGKYELDPDIFSTTKFVMNVSVRKNSVSALHAVFEKKRHPQSELISITNGVYKKRWQAKDLLTRGPEISDEELWSVKRKLRENLATYVQGIVSKKINPDICTVVWARRFASYKRPFLVFSDYERLVKLLSNQEHPVQLIIAGKAHAADEEGKEIVRKITALAADPATHGRITYIPRYSLEIAQALTKGADIWLNTPERGKEACGTSGMKAALNGSLQCSISDGWVDEVNWGGRGWILPEENTARVLYDLLEHEILPDFYASSGGDIPHAWIKKMRSTIELVEKNYTTSQMFDRYIKDLYKL